MTLSEALLVALLVAFSPVLLVFYLLATIVVIVDNITLGVRPLHGLHGTR